MAFLLVAALPVGGRVGSRDVVRHAKPRTPAGLGTRGRAFWREVVSTWILQPDEVELLAEICRLLDVLDDLNATAERDGTMVLGSTGQPRVNPAIAEARQTRLAVGRLVAQLGLPDPEGKHVDSLTTERARNAANKRWGNRADSA